MVSKRQTIVAFVVVVLVIISGLIYLTQPSPESRLQAMILKPSEIGPGWQSERNGEVFYYSYNYSIPPGMISFENQRYWIDNYTYMTQNESWHPFCYISLLEFDTVANCSAFFAQASQNVSGWSGYSYRSLGDGAFHVENVGNDSEYEFMKGTVLGWVAIQNQDSFRGPYSPWWEGVLLNIYDLQLSKINQHRGS